MKFFLVMILLGFKKSRLTLQQPKTLELLFTENKKQNKNWQIQSELHHDSCLATGCSVTGKDIQVGLWRGGVLSHIAKDKARDLSVMFDGHQFWTIDQQNQTLWLLTWIFWK